MWTYNGIALYLRARFDSVPFGVDMHVGSIANVFALVRVGSVANVFALV